MAGHGAHRGEVCRLHQRLCVHTSNLFPFFAMNMDSVDLLSPSPWRWPVLGWKSADGALNSITTPSLFVSCPQSCTSPSRPFSGMIQEGGDWDRKKSSSSINSGQF